MSGERLTAADLAQVLSSRGLRVQSTRAGHRAQCPACRSRRRDLSVSDSPTTGRTLVHCFAGCTFAEVCTALGVEEHELAPFERQNLASRDSRDFASGGRVYCVSDLSSAGVPPPSPCEVQEEPEAKQGAMRNLSGNANSLGGIFAAQKNARCVVVRANCDQLLDLWRSGDLEPLEVEVDMPPHAGRVMRVVAADVALVFGLRLAVGKRGAVPYAVGWVAERTGEDKRKVSRAMRSSLRRAAAGCCAAAGRCSASRWSTAGR